MAWGLAFLGLAAAQVSTSHDPSRPGQLTAGDIDDNLNFEWLGETSNASKLEALRFYLGFQARTAAKLKEKQLPQPILEDRVHVQVLDANGTAFSCAVVVACCTRTGETVELATGSDGQVSFFPSWDGLVAASFRAQSPSATCPCSEEQAGNGTLVLQLPTVSSLPTALDVTFTVDTTGSMADELRFLQSEIQAILEGLSLENVRAGLVLYKDQNEAYVVRSSKMGSVASIVQDLRAAEATGGGDYPEAMHEALEAAVALDWRAGNVARVMFLVADAPPHSDKFDRALAAARVARAKGIKVYGLAASGVGDSAEYLMRLMSMLTGARYMWLTDDSGIGNPHAEPKVQCYQVTRLEQLIQRVLLSELAGGRIEAEAKDVVREVGRQEKGVCIVELTTSAPSEGCADCVDVVDAGGSLAGGSLASGEGEPVASGSVLSSVIRWNCVIFASLLTL